MVSAGWMPTVYDKKVEVDEKTSQAVSEIFDLNYAYIGQVATYGKDPLVIYFRIDDVKIPEKDKPHGIAYTSDNLPPSIDNGNRKVVYTERISNHWFYYEKEVYQPK